MNKTLCYECSGTGKIDRSSSEQAVCLTCGGSGYRKDTGRLVQAATRVMERQRAKGIAKYGTDLEHQQGYTVAGMIDMAAEELADGSVYVQKVREQYLALLDEIDQHLTAAERPSVSLANISNIIRRERANVR